ncbi:MAG: hypothetical protein ACXADW_22350 [Candidatus Hodarchaeales archaeon]
MHIARYAILLLLTSLVLLNCGDKDSSTEPTIPDPIASFTESGEPVTPATIVFQNSSQYADSYLWTAIRLPLLIPPTPTIHTVITRFHWWQEIPQRIDPILFIKC